MESITEKNLKRKKEEEEEKDYDEEEEEEEEEDEEKLEEKKKELENKDKSIFKSFSMKYSHLANSDLLSEILPNNASAIGTIDLNRINIEREQNRIKQIQTNNSQIFQRVPFPNKPQMYEYSNGWESLLNSKVRNANIFISLQNDSFIDQNIMNSTQSVVEFKNTEEINLPPSDIMAIKWNNEKKKWSEEEYDRWLYELSSILYNRKNNEITLQNIEYRCWKMFIGSLDILNDINRSNFNYIKYTMTEKYLNDIINVILLSINNDDIKDEMKIQDKPNNRNINILDDEFFFKVTNWIFDKFIRHYVQWSDISFQNPLFKQHYFNYLWPYLKNILTYLKKYSQHPIINQANLYGCKLNKADSLKRSLIELKFTIKLDEDILCYFGNCDFVMISSNDKKNNSHEMLLGRLLTVDSTNNIINVCVSGYALDYINRKKKTQDFLDGGVKIQPIDTFEQCSPNHLQYIMENAKFIAQCRIDNSVKMKDGIWNHVDLDEFNDRLRTCEEISGVDTSDISRIYVQSVISQLSCNKRWDTRAFNWWLYGLSLLLYYGKRDKTTMEIMEDLCWKFFRGIFDKENNINTEESSGTWIMSLGNRMDQIFKVICLSINLEDMKKEVLQHMNTTEHKNKHPISHNIQSLCSRCFERLFANERNEKSFLEPIEFFIDTFLHYYVQWADGSFRNEQYKHYYFERYWLSLMDLLEILRDVRNFRSAHETSELFHCELIRIGSMEEATVNLEFQYEKEDIRKLQECCSFGFGMVYGSETNIVDRKLILGQFIDVNARKPTLLIKVARCTLNTLDIDDSENNWLRSVYIAPLGPSGLAFRVQAKALAYVVSPKCEVDADLLSLICEQTPPNNPKAGLFEDAIDKEQIVETKLFNSLNSSQQQAVKTTLKQKLTLIQGPPGTGKTEVAVAIVEQFHHKINAQMANEQKQNEQKQNEQKQNKSQKKNQNKKPDQPKILVCAFSNAAVDVLCKRLFDYKLPCLRVGSRSSLDLETYGDILLEKFPVYEWGKKIKEAPVIACTCVGVSNRFVEKQKFSLILIDENSQCTEIGLLPPLITLQRGGTMVLIGDHKQLPPTVISACAKKRGLHISLFERLIENGKEVEFLDTQYRMHQAICEFPSDEFYNGRLKTAPGLLRKVPRGFPWPINNYPLCFVDVRGFKERADATMSTENEMEARLIIRIACQLLEDNHEYSRITIITPYQAQRANIEGKLFQACGPTYKDCYEICTVDGFQGNESEVIIFSAVRSNEIGMIGFVKDRARVNVMLTRPKAGLIVVGNMKTLEAEKIWRRWFENVVHENKAYLDFRDILDDSIVLD